jgi:hypothetical protein
LDPHAWVLCNGIDEFSTIILNRRPAKALFAPFLVLPQPLALLSDLYMGREPIPVNLYTALPSSPQQLITIAVNPFYTSEERILL